MTTCYSIQIIADEHVPLTCATMGERFCVDSLGDLAVDYALDETLSAWHDLDGFIHAWREHIRRHGVPAALVRNNEAFRAFLASPQAHDEPSARRLALSGSAAALLSDVDPASFPHLSARALIIHIVAANPSSQVPEPQHASPLVMRILAAQDGPTSPIQQWFDQHADITLCPRRVIPHILNDGEYLDFSLLARCLFLLSVEALPTNHLGYPLDRAGRLFRVCVPASMLATPDLRTDEHIPTEAYHTFAEREGYLLGLEDLLQSTHFDDDRLALLARVLAAGVIDPGWGADWDHVTLIVAALEEPDAVAQAAAHLQSVDVHWQNNNRELPAFWRGADQLPLRRQFFTPAHPMTPLYNNAQVRLVDTGDDALTAQQAHLSFDNTQPLVWPSGNQIETLALHLHTARMFPACARVLSGDLAALRSLKVLWYRPSERTAPGLFPAAILDVLLNNPTLANLEALSLIGFSLGDEALGRLRACPHLPSLQAIEQSAL